MSRGCKFNQIANVLATVRCLNAGQSYAEIAASADKTQTPFTTLWKIRSGETENPRIETVRAIWPELIGAEGAPSVPSVGTDQCGTSDQKGSASSDSPKADGVQCTRMDMSAPNQIGLLTACPSATELTSKDTDLTSTLTDCPHRAVSASAIADCTSSNE